ncbi:XRE family transcriptional regulator [Cupriavidus sp. DF5525]|uniref:XRE family transcriptional regulator n=1 Tax=Cupriavidus sp. DF5525 TaxID=3160989 RepID=UPI0032E02843
MNVYAELRFPDAGAMRAKADVAMTIAAALERRGWTARDAAKLLSRPDLPRILRGHFRDVREADLREIAGSL